MGTEAGPGVSPIAIQGSQVSGCREVIAGVVLHRARLAILRRSARVTGENGRWNVITGHLEPGVMPLWQAYQEIREEAGIRATQLQLLSTAVRRIPDPQGQDWTVHVFLFESDTDRIVLNWENDDCHWVTPGDLAEFDTVSWIHPVLECCRIRMPSARFRPRADNQE